MKTHFTTSAVIMDTARVMIIEDDGPTRARLVDEVTATDGLELSASVDSCAAARQHLASHESPDVMLVDLGLPDGSGIDLIKESRTLTPLPEVMVISVFGDEKHLISAIEAGATGYLLKDADNVAESIQQLVKGGSPISSSLARHLLKRFRPDTVHTATDSAEMPQLTPRETQVLQLIAKGFTFAEIADTLELSIHTISSHVKNTYRKLEVRSRSEAVFEAVQRGIVDL
ncbi:MAG: response regulator transcription factor [Pseudomonadota bacterium]